MSQEFSFTETPHRAFGVLAALGFPGQPTRSFTRQEAAIVSRALKALVQATSTERQVYMSPIASDHDFEARVVDGGIVVIADGCVDFQLNWNDAGDLARRLDRFGAGA